MTPEETEKLFKSFPLIYRGKDKSIMESLMPFGFECGSGWYNIIYELSSKIEKIAQDIKKGLVNPNCLSCGCLKDRHFGSATNSPGKCLAVKKRLNKLIFKSYKAKSFWYVPIAWIKYQIHNLHKWCIKTFDYHLEVCYCEKYDWPVPIVVQVKEKYGTLRFYMHGYNEEIEGLIDEAEEKSAKTCETCGEPGVLRGGGWYYTACDKCAKNRNGVIDPPTNE